VTAGTATVGHALVVADTADVERDDWLAMRRRGIGGSDVSAIVGLNSWRTPLQTWLEKTGIYTPDDDPSEAMEWGNLLEPVVADEFSRRSGVPTVEYRALLAHPEHDWMLANVDRLIPKDPVERVELGGVYEGKTTSPWQRKEWADNKVPDHALLQTQHYLGVTHLPYAYIAVLIGGQRLEWRRVERDDELIARLVELEHEFWQRVEQMDPPAPTEADSAFLGEVWSPAPESTLVLTPDLLDALAAREAAKAAEKQAKALAAEAEARIKLALGDHEYGVTDAGVVVCSWREIPETEVAAFTRRSYRRFIPHKAKETV
jgi:putative phage-type endonuclease